MTEAVIARSGATKQSNQLDRRGRLRWPRDDSLHLSGRIPVDEVVDTVSGFVVAGLVETGPGGWRTRRDHGVKPPKSVTRFNRTAWWVGGMPRSDYATLALERWFD
jgi:hypothetical protein